MINIVEIFKENRCIFESTNAGVYQKQCFKERQHCSKDEMDDCQVKTISKDSKVSKQTHIIEGTSATGDKQFHCTACGKTFRSRTQKYYHLNCNKLQDMIYKCEYCDKSFARHSQWKYHVESHISPINECPKCHKTFSNPLALKKHEALHNVEPKPCPHCDKTFQKKISLDQHIAAQHLNQLQFGCAYCNKKYASKSTLHLHLQSHEKKRFECSVCGKLFQRNSILKLHLKRHFHTNNYKCSVCHKSFSESGALSRHRKIHEENVLQYHCKLCSKSILRKDNMTRHLNTMHPEVKFEEIVEILSSLPHESIEQTNLSAKESGTEDLNEKQITNNNYNTTSSHEKCIIIENKIIKKSFQQQENEVIDTSEISKELLATNENISSLIQRNNEKNDFIDLPIVNQIQVITAVPIYEKVCISTDNNDTSKQIQPLQYITLENLTTSEQISQSPYNEMLGISCTGKSTSENSSAILDNSNNIIMHTINETSQPIYSVTKEQKFFIREESSKALYALAEQSSTKVTPATQTISSVIKSIGNVKKNLTPTIVTVAKPTPSNSFNLEYKHKKYCRNNYDIDLYRKILGCDDDDSEDYNSTENYDNQEHRKEDDEQQNSLKESYNTVKSSTPVHWRKSFKNNYETSTS